MKDPKTRKEWQEAVDLAHVYILIAGAVQYGFVIYDGKINIPRCEEILEKGRKRGITPRADAVQRWARELVTEKKK